jgi:hypothetical protein
MINIERRNQASLRTIVQEFIEGVEKHCSVAISIVYAFKNPLTDTIMHFE